MVSKITNFSAFSWIVPFIYDEMAFVPQSMIGYISDKYPKFNFGLMGVVFLVVALMMYNLLTINVFVPLIILCLGNCFLHISGAENTLKCSEGKLAHSAIFVAGGSFGVITGKLLAKTMLSFWWIVALCLTMIPFIMLARTYLTDESNCEYFHYASKKVNPYLIVLIAFLVVVVRGYMGYGIPTAWNKTTIQTVILFCIMGVGKALGGILSDAFGIRKVAFLSTMMAIPFLCFGDQKMLVSLVGVMFFSMTMAITLGILVSVLKKKPGLAFGITTIGLFCGTMPIFFVKMVDMRINIAMIISMSFVCMLLLLKVLDKPERLEEKK